MDPKPDHGETSYAARAVLPDDSDMGRAAAIAYAREGADVAINYLPNEEPHAQEVVQMIQAAGRTAVHVPGDLREESFCQQLVSRALQGFGDLNIVVSNAGRQQSRPSILGISTKISMLR